MRPLRAVAACLLLFSLADCTARHERAPAAPAPNGQCVPLGEWVVPKGGARLSTPQLIDRVAGSRVVLLGEMHDRPEHHRWELQTIAALQARRPIVLAFEMFPRRVQPVLDRWVAGELSEKQFLDAVDWNQVWNMPAALYMPLFDFARMNRVPMVALNVDRSLIAEVGAHGWQDVPAAEREGISTPAPASPQYERQLAEVLRKHGEPPHPVADEDTRLHNFVAAQLVWDRAFAQGIGDATQRWPQALVIGIIGSGHLEYGYGVPHQLADLGVHGVTALLPWEEESDCSDLTPDLADAVFGLRSAPAPEEKKPRLGVAIEKAPEGVRIVEVSKDSVAAAAGIRAGDVVTKAAGVNVQEPVDLQKIVARQAPGTWLPLQIRRGKREREIVARFPSGEGE
jgi:uncharacterized iron-regulated protein